MPRNPLYAEAEVSALRRLFPAAPAKEILAALPGRNWQTLVRKAASLGFRRKRRMATEWSEADCQVLRTHYPSGGAAAVLPLLSRASNFSAINKKAGKLGVVMGGRVRYTEQERELIRALYPTASVPALLAALPGRTLKALGKEAQDMGLARRAIVWQPASIDYLRANYAAIGPAGVAQALGLLPRQVKAKACLLKITCRKPAAPKLATVKKVKPAAPPTPVKAPKGKLTPPPALPKALTALPEHDPRPKSKNTLKPLHIVGAATKADPRTPVLNASKAIRQRGEKAAKAESITEQVKKLPYGHPARMAYMLNAKHGGPAATAAFHAAINQAA